MFNLLSYATLAFTAASSVSGLVVPRSTAPASWATNYLEPYTNYHIRYIAIGCQNKHGQPFFNLCCHPLLATEKLETARPAQCIPSASASSSASAIEPASTAKTSVDTSSSNDGQVDDGDCIDDNSTFPITPSSTTDAPVSTSTPSPTEAPAPSSTSTSHPDIVSAATPPEVTTAEPPKASPTALLASSNVNTGGFATYFYQNGVAGACGTVHGDGDMIAAIDGDRYGDLGKQSGLCGKKVLITNPANGKTVTVTIADACPTCNNGNSIDLSVSAFQKIATLSQGLVSINWSYV